MPNKCALLDSFQNIYPLIEDKGCTKLNSDFSKMHVYPGPSKLEIEYLYI
jgi:hypothetical protein